MSHETESKMGLSVYLRSVSLARSRRVLRAKARLECAVRPRFRFHDRLHALRMAHCTIDTRKCKYMQLYARGISFFKLH